ncbi:MAG: hypothetical protein Q7R42_05825 [Candidatus Planktophila sp.]|nr:hypothetical protein [Candidatus Planktophila sp.]
MAKKKYVAPKAVAQETFPTPIALGIKAFAITGSLIFIIQLLRGSAQSEAPDKAIYLLAILIAGVFLLLGFSKLSKSTGKYLHGSLAFIVTAIGIAGIEEHEPINGVVLSDRLWLGFGPYVLLLAVLITPIVFKIIEWRTLNIAWKAILSTLFLINAVLVIPSFWQSAAAVIDADHSEYVINELLAPVVGYWPYSDFIPQYQSFYGFFLKPFVGGMNASQISEVAFIALTLLSFATLILGVFIAWNAIDRRSVVLAIGLVIPFTALTQFPTREGYLGSIAALLSGLSIRIFPGLVLIGLLILLLRKRSEKSTVKQTIAFLAFGFISGLTTWQSQDFGIAAVVTSFLVIAYASSTRLLEIKNTGIALIGFISGFALYPIIAGVAGKTIDFKYFLFFARQFGSGFGAERIRTPGPVLFILPLIVLLVVVHGIYVYRSKKSASEIGDYSLNALIGFSFGLWSLFGFTYYLNRSYASGQMQILFLPLSISLAAFVGILIKDPIRNLVFGNLQKGFLFSPRAMKEKNFAWVLPLLLIISIPFASLLLTPNPSVEMKRIDESKTAPRWPKATIVASVADARIAAKYAKDQGLTIGFFGASSYYVEKESGVQSLSILNSPFDLFMSQTTAQTSCDYINTINPDVIVVSDEGTNLFQFEGKTLCNTYIQQDIPGVRSGHFAVKVAK